MTPRELYTETFRQHRLRGALVDATPNAPLEELTLMDQVRVFANWSYLDRETLLFTGWRERRRSTYWTHAKRQAWMRKPVPTFREFVVSHLAFA